MAGSCAKLHLLLWKNFTIQLRQPIATVVGILLPFLFFAFILVIVSFGKSSVSEETLHEAVNVSINLNISEIHWCPVSPILTNLMNRMLDVGAESQTKRMKLTAYDNEKAMMKVLDSSNKTGVVGVIFGDGIGPINALPMEIQITVCITEMDTDRYFPVERFQVSKSEFGNSDQYFHGFLHVQYALSAAIMESVRNLPKIMFKRFPSPSYNINIILPFVHPLLLFIYIVSFMYPCYSIVTTVSQEKELQLKEAMKSMGISNWIHWTAWFIKSLVFLMISVLLIMMTLVLLPTPHRSLFRYSDPSIIFIFLMILMIQIICVCFVLAVVFPRAIFGGLASIFLWMSANTLFLMKMGALEKNDLYEILLFSLLPGYALNLGTFILIQFEKIGEGMKWRYILSTIDMEMKCSLGHLMGVMLLESAFLFLLTLYIEAVFPGRYGIPKPWYFLCQPSYWFWKSHDTSDSHDTSTDNPETFEAEPTDLPLGIKVMNLSKKYHRNKVVNDLNVRMYKGQITVLLGHNGAGKTTTISMLTGIIQPSSGTVIVEGFNIKTDTERARGVLGLCPQHNALFRDLTVRDHLYFYSKMKGLDGGQLKAEIQKYLSLLNLQANAQTKSKNLSGGMKRKLCVGIAFIGGSKVVVLDEPSAGMDPTARRGLWDLLQTEKKEHTIMLTTHLMDEADALGDRIAIMHSGSLVCCGSSFFLKQKYGEGYHLVIEKGSKCNVAAVIKLLQRSIPNLRLEKEMGSELSYILKEQHRPLFEEMLLNLERNKSSLGVESFGIYTTTMEEVFLKVGHVTDQQQQQAEASAHLDSTEQRILQNAEVQLVGGATLVFYQLLAMFMKRALYARHTWITTLFNIFLPCLLLCQIFFYHAGSSVRLIHAELQISLEDYGETFTPIKIAARNPEVRSIADIYRNNTKGSYIVKGDMENHLLEKYKADFLKVRNYYIVGATFEDDKITCWYNGVPLHSAPLTLLLIQNAVLKKYTGHSVKLVNRPLINAREEENTNEEEILGMNMAQSIVSYFDITVSFYLLFYVRERGIEAKHLQFVSGLSVLIYWMSSLVWDLIMYFLATVAVIVVFGFLIKKYTEILAEVLGAVAVLILTFGWAVLPLVYLFSFLFRKPLLGFIIVYLMLSFTGTIPTFFFKKIEGIFETNYDWIFIPSYGLQQGVQKVMIRKETGKFYDWEEGISPFVMTFIVEGIVLNILIYLIELNIFRRMLYMMKPYMMKSNSDRQPPQLSIDTDVATAIEKIQKTETQTLLQEYDILLKDVTKKYGNYVAVARLCLGMKRGECFGLLGVNGAGKTTTFKMMTGALAVTGGNIYINGQSLKSNLFKAFQCMGYCPQFEALLPELTVKETLTIYCLIRGIPRKQIHDVIYELADELLFTEHMKKKISDCSGGNQRKVSTCVAILGNPLVVFMDEPTAGMDPVAKRKVWNMISWLRNVRSCVILTSHSMEECEALCTQLAIMVNGQLKCLGSNQHLKTKFSKGYILMIKVKKREKADSSSNQGCDLESIKGFVNKTFPSAFLEEEYLCLLTYSIADSQMSLSKMFGVMEKAKRQMDIADYSLGQTNLEQVFLSLTKKQVQIGK